MEHAFTPRSTATLLVQDQHIRFLKEARAGTPLHMTGAVVTMEESGATLLQVLYHSRTGEPAASFLTRIAHASPLSLRPFPWPSRAREAAEALVSPVPPFAGPRSIAGGPVESSASMERAEHLGLGCIGRGVVGPRDCDVFGRMAVPDFIGRVSDGVPGLLSGVRTAVGDAAEAPVARIGGAVLEYRLVYLRWPQAGDHLELRSGLAGVEEKTQRLVHWLLDPSTGAPWASAEAVAVNLDLDARKIVPIAPRAREALKGRIIADLAL
jgi:acyl-CoA thioester hydrolase